jgi:hypothetical protein
MAIKKVELLVCDDCNCISTGNPEEEVPCMECGKTMARVEFVRQPTQREPDVCWSCGKPWSEHRTNRVGHEVCP